MSKAATKRRPQPEVEEKEVPVCAHRWVIESPNGATSLGKCRVCGAEKEFPNSAEDWLFERDVPQSRWTGRTEYRAPAEGF
jgi:hypothetical protein